LNCLVPDHRKHRGPHPEDEALFGAPAVDALRTAVDHASWLLTHGYAPKSSIKLVGDRFKLSERQRVAVLRSACSDHSRSDRRRRKTPVGNLAGAVMDVDGFNLLTTIEAALAGGVILAARDGCYRDMASMHGSYRKVAETESALQLIGDFFASAQIDRCTWYLDRPVSNSGRLRQTMLDMAKRQGWPWQTELACDVDRQLKMSPHIVISTDSAVIDRCRHWANLGREIICRHVPAARVIAMAD
jgi:hypothetical protein